MPTITKLIRKHLLRNIPDRMPDINSLKQTERSHIFEYYRMNRKIMGAFRYGLMGDKNKSKYDCIEDMIRRLEEYKKDKNGEHLVDVANLSELEFVEGDCNWQPLSESLHTKEI